MYQKEIKTDKRNDTSDETITVNRKKPNTNILYREKQKNKNDYSIISYKYKLH